MRIYGMIPPMLTPTLDRDGGIDVAALSSFTEFLVAGGVHGLFPCGSIGEFSSLTRDERRTVVKTVVEASGDTPVIAGCGGTSLAGVIANVDAAADAGADAAVVVTPYYLSTTQEGLAEFFTLVADRSPLPIVLYNIPQLTGQEIAVETVTELAAHDSIVAIKDSSGNATYHYELVEMTPDEFSVIQGITALALSSLDAGADGVIGGPANVFPGLLAELYDAYERGDRDRAVTLMNDVVNPLVSTYASLPTPVAIKFLARWGGHEVGPPLVPLSGLTRNQEQRLVDAYETVESRVNR
ncbi:MULTISPECIES: dihydrodipicolinate synthase family protein [unclassified Haladaptatus]|uniref:dihydrodipicolinate synthase family protein n=1 Tax=unclassified Haladaptatus TaxID=2622732 RepID=UPI0023E8348D|nr:MULTISPECIES: dihydrodipicolinate synthase family protein [unclassified Haladaptatus]